MIIKARLVILILLSGLFVNAQEKVTIDTTAKVFSKVEKEANFPGGLPGWRNYLINNLNADVPIKNGAPVGKYTVLVQFKVCTDGSLCDIEAINNPGFGLTDEAIRVIKESGNWVPAEQFGRKVKSIYKQPISFMVEESSGFSRKRKKRNKE
jgi:protein TonB